ncbi:MAG: glycoside hydrolase, partial [Actinomycetota bacterium]|nr:glycoside hydrolase [Actinomycetota bacterium]
VAARLAVVLGFAVALLGALLLGWPDAGENRDGERVVVGREVPVTPMNLSWGAANNSPVLMADPTQHSFVVLANRLDAPAFNCALQVSGDGGRSWLPADPVPQLPPDAEKCYAPEVAFDRAGRLYYLFVGLAGRGNEPMGVFLTTSDDRGRTFSPPHQVLGGLNFAVRMAIDPSLGETGRLHLVWLQATSDPPTAAFGPPPNPILAAYSDDGGRTFSEPVQVSSPQRARVVAPALALGPGHAVHVAYYDLQDDAVDYQGLEGPTWPGNWSVVLASSFDAGRSFDTEMVIDHQVKPHERVMLIFTMTPPAVVADPSGRVCAAWTDARFGDGDAVLRCSADRGATWGSLQRLNDDLVGNGATQYQPRLAFAPEGRLDAVFYDRREDPQNVANHVSFTYSSDGAKSFAPNLRLTSDPSSTLIGQRYVNVSAEGMVEFGSRMGLLSQPDGAVAAWTDTRNTRLGTSQDIFVSSVLFPAPGPGSQRRLAGLALLAAGTAIAALAWGYRSREARPQEKTAGEPQTARTG